MSRCGELWRQFLLQRRDSTREWSESLREEIEFHLTERLHEQLNQGQSPDAAREETLRRFGDIGATARGCRREHSVAQGTLHRIHLLVTAGLIVALFAVWTESRHNTAEQAASLPASPAVAPRSEFSTTRDPSIGYPGEISGQVLDEDNQPVALAHLLAVVKTWPKRGYRQQAHVATSGPDGRFSLAGVYPLDERCEIQLAVVADRRPFQSAYFTLEKQALEPVVFHLEPSSSFALQLRTVQGGHISGAEVLPHVRVDASGRNHLVYFQGADSIIRTSDRAGIVELPFFRAGDRATVYVRVPGSNWQTRELLVPDEQHAVVLELDGEDGELELER